jgi:hypothetical protein
MDTYQLVELLVKMGVFFGRKDRFVIKDYLVTLFTVPDFDGNRLEVSERHPVLTGGFIPWYSYDHGEHKGHCFHTQVLNAQVLRQVLSAAIIKWYSATAVDMVTKPGTYLELIDKALTLDPDFKGHIRTVEVDPRMEALSRLLPYGELRKIVDEHLLKLPFEEAHSWGMPLTPYSGGIHVNAKLNKADTKMPPKSYEECLEGLDDRERLRIDNNHYNPTKGEPSPFGEAPLDCEHPWTAWRRNHFSTPVGLKGDELRKQLCAVLEAEPYRPLTIVSLINDHGLECDGHLTLGWVISMYYNFGRKSWEEIHQVGLERIKYYRRKQEQ